MSSTRQATYKPLLFTTTVRSPERIKDFLGVIAEYDGEVLTDQIIEKIAHSLIKTGLYKPTQVSSAVKAKWKNGVELEDAEVRQAFEDNPQDHKEAGFDKGWPSRFDTWYKLPKELGFVWYWPGDKIQVSETAKLLIDRDNPQNETIVFANAFAKYYRNNPFKRVLNTGTPLVLLLKTIKLLNDDKTYNGAGISYQEIPILLCWKNDDANELYQKIKELRAKHGYSPSNETILEICRGLIDEIVRDDKSLLVDYPDEFVRKMRLTGLITVRGGGRFIDANKKETKAVDYLLDTTSEVAAHESEKEFFAYIGELDKDFVATLSVTARPVASTNEELNKWTEHYSWEVISRELLSLANPRGRSQDDILKIIEGPLRLEFLTAIAINKKLPKVSVKPSYISDDEGLPTSFAPGVADIECHENGGGVLVEVTLLRGTQQHIRESYAIQRHLEEYKAGDSSAYTILITPAAYIDTVRHAKYIKDTENLDVRVIDIDKFVGRTETEATLNSVSAAL